MEKKRYATKDDENNNKNKNVNDSYFAVPILKAAGTAMAS